MNKEDLYEAIGELDEKDLKKPEKIKKKKFVWAGAAAAVIAVTLCVSLLVPSFIRDKGPTNIPSPDNNEKLKVCALSLAHYPQMAPYPAEEYPKSESEIKKYEKKYDAWLESKNAQKRPQGYADGVSPFLNKTMKTFLTSEEGKNKVISPLNMYMALSMLAEITDSDTRQEIMDVLGQKDIAGLRRQANDIWNAQYINDGATSMVMANSLWMNNKYNIKKESLDILSSDYYASSFSGTPGSEEYDEALRNWLNSQTGNLLKDKSEEISMDPNSVITLASALMYQAKWETEFWKDNTEKGEFMTPGGKTTVDFMHSGRPDNYYWAEHFGAISLTMEDNGGKMWFLLPDEGITPEQILKEDETYRFIEEGTSWPQQKNLIINTAVPKFDISDSMDLQNKLQTLGIKKVFSENADFSPITDNEVFVSEASHSARIKIDEEGVSAAAFTVISTDGACKPPEDKMDFILDRPFVFVLASSDGLPLLCGTVNQP